jgi:hypothetical protein
LVRVAVPKRFLVSGGERQVQGEEVGLRHHVVELGVLDAGGRAGPGRDQRIVGQHLHAQADRALGHLAADVAEAQHAQGLAGDLDAGELLLLPLALLHAGGGLGDLAGQGEHEGDGQLARGDGVARRGC